MPTHSLSLPLRPFGLHIYTKMTVEYPPGLQVSMLILVSSIIDPFLSKIPQIIIKKFKKV